MSWMRLGLTVLTSGIVSSLTDWLFMGDWLYKRYDRHPEIWRYPRGEGESKAIAWSSPLPFLTCAFFALICYRLQLHQYSSAFKLALLIWLAAPLPLIVTNALFIKVAPMIAASHSLGWLVKLILAAAATVLIIG
ncbi:MAG TPA: hypothetical protein VNW72_06655 [Chthoniobacterales bacterium]|jgi:hypothetical protein|nr:hypothetical protein [Chthoniobacterales bacterium]